MRNLRLKRRLAETRSAAEYADLRAAVHEEDFPCLDTGFRGNKANLPSKPCAQCGRPMSWRRKWARAWDTVRYCSDRCHDAAARERRA